MKHIEFEQLVEIFEGLRSETENREVFDHLRICDDCNKQAQKLENFFGYAKIAESAQAGQALTANLLNIYKPRKSVLAKKSYKQCLLATLVFDDWQFALNERLVYSDTRQLLYQTALFDIDLRLHFIGDKCQISGQIFPDCKGGSVEIYSSDFSEMTSLNEKCEFVFSLVKQEIYTLRFVSEDVSIEIENISLLN